MLCCVLTSECVASQGQPDDTCHVPRAGAAPVPLISSNTGAGQRRDVQLIDGYKHWHWRMGKTWRHLHNVAPKAAMLESAADHNTVSSNLDNLFTWQQLTTVLLLRLYFADEDAEAVFT